MTDEPVAVRLDELGTVVLVVGVVVLVGAVLRAAGMVVLGVVVLGVVELGAVVLDVPVLGVVVFVAGGTVVVVELWLAREPVGTAVEGTVLRVAVSGGAMPSVRGADLVWKLRTPTSPAIVAAATI